MKAIEYEELNQLQVFLLVLVGFGLATPYDLMLKVGLGPGLTSPALKRLENAGLLTSKAGPRNRVRYALTKTGADRLRESLRLGEGYWRPLDFGRVDIYATLPRAIILAWLHSGVDEAQRVADRAAELLKSMLPKVQRDAESHRESLLHLHARAQKGDPTAHEGNLIGAAYKWINAECDAAQFGFEVGAVARIRNLLPGLPPAPRTKR